MTIFAVLLPMPQPKLAAAIKRAFPDDYYMLNDTQWLISASGTAIDITARLGIYDAANPEAEATGGAIIFATSSYYGRAPGQVWDWVRAKLEGATGGQRRAQ
jgi:hypothetical protein